MDTLFPVTLQNRNLAGCHLTIYIFFYKYLRTIELASKLFKRFTLSIIEWLGAKYKGCGFLHSNLNQGSSLPDPGSDSTVCCEWRFLQVNTYSCLAPQSMWKWGCRCFHSSTEKKHLLTFIPAVYTWILKPWKPTSLFSFPFQGVDPPWTQS